jgi:hypothetical protein
MIGILITIGAATGSIKYIIYEKGGGGYSKRSVKVKKDEVTNEH